MIYLRIILLLFCINISCEKGNISNSEDRVDIQGYAIPADTKSLDLTAKKVSDLSGLEKLENLTFLRLGLNPISNIESIRGLKSLEIVEFGGQKFNDYSPIQGLSNLKELRLTTMAPIGNSSFLSKLHSLERLDLSCTQINTLPIKNLSKLKRLNIAKTGIKNLNTLPDSIKILIVSRDIDANALDKYIKSNPECKYLFNKSEPCSDWRKIYEPGYELEWEPLLKQKK